MINLKQDRVTKYGGYPVCEYPICENGRAVVEYEKWTSMFKRCYSKSIHDIR